MEVFIFLSLFNNLPYITALFIMLGIFGLEVITGSGISEAIDDIVDADTDFDVDVDAVDMDVDIDVDVSIEADHDMDIDTGPAHDTEIDHIPGGFMSGILGWLQVGKVPFLILLSVFLASFGAIGLVGQYILYSTFGFTVNALVGGPIALLAALYPTRTFGKFLGRLMPKIETSAISLDSLVGKTAKITLGTAKTDLSAEAKLIDDHNQTHYIRVVPLNDDEEFTSGTEVRLVKKEGNIFKVIGF